MTRVIKVSKKTLESFKNARGINDPRRVGKIQKHYVSYDYFCQTFLPELEHCDTEKQIDWVSEAMTGEMFDDAQEDGLDLEIYYVEKENNGCWGTLCWKCNDYSNEWKEETYNTSSIFALCLCSLDYESESD
jgi:hypothetical protein